MSQLHLSLLGVPRVQHAETTLSFSTRKAQALLFYLALEGGLHERKALSEAFWPDLDAEHGRAALRATLLELRRLFERTHNANERPHLRVEHDLLGIAQDNSLLLDLRQLEAASKLVEGRVAAPDELGHEALIQQLEQASRLVRGPFLKGFSLRDSQFFDDWSSQHREHWHQRASQVFAALSLLYEQGGELEHACETVSRWLRFDPLNEEGHRRLMRLRFAQGDRVGAFRAYDRCRAVLLEALEVEPEPETVALVTRLRQTAPPVRPAQTQEVEVFAGKALQTGQPLSDMQQADPTTLDLLLSLTRRLAEQPTSVLLLFNVGAGNARNTDEQARWQMAFRTTDAPFTSVS